MCRSAKGKTPTNNAFTAIVRSKLLMVVGLGHNAPKQSTMLISMMLMMLMMLTARSAQRCDYKPVWLEGHALDFIFYNEHDQDNGGKQIKWQPFLINSISNSWFNFSPKCKIKLDWNCTMRRARKKGKLFVPFCHNFGHYSGSPELETPPANLDVASVEQGRDLVESWSPSIGREVQPLIKKTAGTGASVRLSQHAKMVFYHFLSQSFCHVHILPCTCHFSSLKQSINIFYWLSSDHHHCIAKACNNNDLEGGLAPPQFALDFPGKVVRQVRRGNGDEDCAEGNPTVAFDGGGGRKRWSIMKVVILELCEY